MGDSERRHRGITAEGAILSDAGRVREGDHAGQTGNEERVRMSGVQDQNARSYVHLDVQFQEPRQTHQVDLGRRRDSSADLIQLPHVASAKRRHVHTRFRARNS